MHLCKENLHLYQYDEPGHLVLVECLVTFQWVEVDLYNGTN